MIVIFNNRTGQDILAGKSIRVDKDGFQNFSDYWSESGMSDTDDESLVSRPDSAKEIVTGCKGSRVSLQQMSSFASSGKLSTGSETKRLLHRLVKSGDSRTSATGVTSTSEHVSKPDVVKSVTTVANSPLKPNESAAVPSTSQPQGGKEKDLTKSSAETASSAQNGVNGSQCLLVKGTDITGSLTKDVISEPSPSELKNAKTRRRITYSEEQQRASLEKANKSAERQIVSSPREELHDPGAGGAGNNPKAVEPKRSVSDSQSEMESESGGESVEGRRKSSPKQSTSITAKKMRQTNLDNLTSAADAVQGGSVSGVCADQEMQEFGDANLQMKGTQNLDVGLEVGKGQRKNGTDKSVKNHPVDVKGRKKVQAHHVSKPVKKANILNVSVAEVTQTECVGPTGRRVTRSVSQKEETKVPQLRQKRSVSSAESQRVPGETGSKITGEVHSDTRTKELEAENSNFSRIGIGKESAAVNRSSRLKKISTATSDEDGTKKSASASVKNHSSEEVENFAEGKSVIENDMSHALEKSAIRHCDDDQESDKAGSKVSSRNLGDGKHRGAKKSNSLTTDKTRAAVKIDAIGQKQDAQEVVAAAGDVRKKPKKLSPRKSVKSAKTILSDSEDDSVFFCLHKPVASKLPVPTVNDQENDSTDDSGRKSPRKKTKKKPVANKRDAKENTKPTEIMIESADKSQEKTKKKNAPKPFKDNSEMGEDAKMTVSPTDEIDNELKRKTQSETEPEKAPKRKPGRKRKEKNKAVEEGVAALESLPRRRGKRKLASLDSCDLLDMSSTGSPSRRSLSHKSNSPVADQISSRTPQTDKVLNNGVGRKSVVVDGRKASFDQDAGDTSATEIIEDVESNEQMHRNVAESDTSTSVEQFVQSFCNDTSCSPNKNVATAQSPVCNVDTERGGSVGDSERQPGSSDAGSTQGNALDKNRNLTFQKKMSKSSGSTSTSPKPEQEDGRRQQKMPPRRGKSVPTKKPTRKRKSPRSKGTFTRPASDSTCEEFNDSDVVVHTKKQTRKRKSPQSQSTFNTGPSSGNDSVGEESSDSDVVVTKKKKTTNKRTTKIKRQNVVEDTPEQAVDERRMSASTTPLKPALRQSGRQSLRKRKSVTYAVDLPTFQDETPDSVSVSRKQPIQKTRRSSSFVNTDTDSPRHYCEVTVSMTPVPTRQTVKQAEKIIRPSPSPDGLRRSQRTRVRPLEWYKNERIVYEKRKSEGFVVAGIQSPISRDHRLCNPPRQNNASQKLNAFGKKLKKEQAKVRRMSIHTSLPPNINFIETEGEIAVVNPSSGEECILNCVASKDSYVYTGPTGLEPQEDDDVLIAKPIKQLAFGCGEIIIKPLKEKPRQIIHVDTLVFYIVKGKVAVTIHETTSLLEAGSSFFVPQGNVYSIKNLRRNEAKLAFFQMKNWMETHTDIS